MKLTEEKVKKVIAQVYKDLELTYDIRYSIRCRFISEENNWVGSYDYREMGKYGERFAGMFPEYIVSIDDETGKAFALHHYSAHMQLILNENNKYIYGIQLNRPNKK